MEKHISRKRLLAGVCALSAAFVLASCDPISATPVNYNEAIIYNNENKPVDMDENKLGKIYDAIAADRNTKIVSDLLDKVATDKFGTYAEIEKAASSDEERTLYISRHGAVFSRKGDEDTEKHHGMTKEQVEAERFKVFYEDIQDRISEFFWNEITSGSYNDDEGRFDESKLWMAHYYEFYEISGREAAEANQFFVTNNHNKYRVFRDGYLKGTYSNPNGDHGYIEEKVFPQILKDKLVEEYVYNTNFASLGRAYARKVSYIKVAYEDHVIPWEMLKNFAKDHIESNTAEYSFEIIAQAIKGFDKAGDFSTKEGDQGIFPLSTESSAYKLLSKTLNGEVTDAKLGIEVKEDYKLGDVVLVPHGWYYRNTKLGEILISYEKAISAENDGRFPIASEKAELDKFTASGKAKEYGLREKLISLSKEDYTTDGWFVKNGGLSELPAQLRDRLFNINVSNIIDDPTLCVLEDGTAEHPMGGYEKADTNRNPYLRNVYGKKFVIPAKTQKFADNPYNYIFQDVSGKAFYIVQVEEAPSTAKLNDTLDKSYVKTSTDGFKTERIARAVSKVLGTKDSYIKDAYTTYLKDYKNFIFYETSLYEHFKSEYPDLFEDEK